VRNWPFWPAVLSFAEQVLVEVALHVLVLRRDLHGVDGLAGLDEQAGLVDLELGVFHLGREGATSAAERLDEGKDGLLDVLERLVGGKLRPVRPAEVGARENGRELLPAKFGGALGVLLALVEAFEKEQEGQLFDGVQGIGQAARPELVPESFDGGAECSVGSMVLAASDSVRWRRSPISCGVKKRSTALRPKLVNGGRTGRLHQRALARKTS